MISTLSLKWLANWVISEAEDRIVSIMLKSLLIFIGKSRESLISFMFDWGYLGFSQAAEMLDNVTGAYEYSTPSIETEDFKVNKEEFIKQDLIRAVKEGGLKIYMNSSSQKSEVLEKEIKIAGNNTSLYSKWYVKKSDFYKYIRDQIKKNDDFQEAKRKMESAEKNNSYLREFDRLKEVMHSMDRKITHYIFKR